MNGQMLVEVCDVKHDFIIIIIILLLHYLNEAHLINICRCCVRNAACFLR